MSEYQTAGTTTSTMALASGAYTSLDKYAPFKPMGVQEQLLTRLTTLRMQVEETEKALAVLNETPNIETLINCLRNSGIYY